MFHGRNRCVSWVQHERFMGATRAFHGRNGTAFMRDIDAGIRPMNCGYLAGAIVGTVWGAAEILSVLKEFPPRGAKSNRRSATRLAKPAEAVHLYSS